MAARFKIGDREIGNFLDPYVIAEIGVNHEGSMELAKRLIDEAAKGGAHAAKFQSYKAGKIASKNSPAYWDMTKEPTDSQYKLFQKYDSFEPDNYRELARYCQEKGIDFMSTPFDLDAVDFLAPLVPVFKIASADITNIPLLRKVARTGKPVILSTGASSLPEIEHAVITLESALCDSIALLHCVLNYPTPHNHAQLGMIKLLRKVFPSRVIGYSDHVIPDESISSLEAAMLLGAAILEKHFTYDKSLPGNDHYHAMDRHDLSQFLRKARLFRDLIGYEGKNLSHEQGARLQARRSIIAAREIQEGELLTEQNLIVKRPGHGISPLLWDEVLGRKAVSRIQEDELIRWDQIA